MQTHRIPTALTFAVVMFCGFLLLGAAYAGRSMEGDLPPLFAPGRTVQDQAGTEFPIKEVRGEWIRTQGLSGIEYWLHVPSGKTWRSK